MENYYYRYRTYLPYFIYNFFKIFSAIANNKIIKLLKSVFFSVRKTSHNWFSSFILVEKQLICNAQLRGRVVELTKPSSRHSSSDGMFTYL